MWWLALAVGVASPLPAPAQEAGNAIVKRGAVAGNLYLAGQRVDVLADVDGDVVAAGGRVSVGDRVRGDVLAAGGVVAVTGEAEDDVRVAGGSVELAAEVAGDAIAAGGSVTVAPEARIVGRAWFAGGEVDVRGHLHRSLHAAGGTVRVGADVQGNVDVSGGTVELLPTARIAGDFTYRSPRPAIIHPEARIAGTVTHVGADAPRAARWMTAAGWVARAALALGLLLAGVALVLLFPGFTTGAVQALRGRPWSSLALGFALWVATPVAVVLLALTGIGIPLGLALIAAYLVALLAGLLVALVALGGLVTRGPRGPARGRLVLALVVGLVVLGLLTWLPVAGVVAAALGLVWGLGALVVHAHRLYVRAA